MLASILEEPKNSTDPFDWLVYADWLEDQGFNSSRIRAIAMGIKKTGGKLWLLFKIYNWDDSKIIVSSTNRKSLNIDDGPTKSFFYFWALERSETSEIYDSSIQESFSWNSPNMELVRKRRPDLLPLFWDKLAEIGNQ